ncbi:hypothetical protein KBB08_04195 [Candidatus Gracilibacteria bacterium]|nr:hypothetical protein [Candidatus Gracilibacteria bacterium]
MHSIHELRRQYEDPRSRDPESFAFYQRGFNDAQLSRLRTELTDQKFIETLSQKTGIAIDDITIAINGSDGRGEKGLSSVIELLAVIAGEYASIEASKAKTRTAIREAIRDFDYPLFNTDSIEVKSIHDKNVGLYVSERANVTMPSRVLDAQPVVGNPILLATIKPLIVDELRLPGGKFMIDDFKERQKKTRETLLTGRVRFQGKEQVHYDLSNGNCIYQPLEHLTAFKQGPLRLAQQRTVIALMTLGRHIDYDTAKRIYTDAPTNLVERLYFLLNEQQFGTYSQVTDFTSLYTYFLWQYAISEYEYTRTQGTVVQFDVQEVKERLEAMLHLDEQFASAKVKIRKSQPQ